jgi:hypothetical protein
MKYRRLGKTGLPVSVIGVGTWQLGGEWGQRSLSTMSTSCWDGLGSLVSTWSTPTSATATTSPRPTVLKEFLTVQAIEERGGLDATADRI